MYTIWDKKSGFNLADGTPCTAADINTRYPFTKNGTIIIERLSNGNVGAIDSLDIIKQVFAIDPALNDNDAVAAIEVERNKPATPVVTETEKLRADVDYIAVMTNVDLEEV